MGLDVQQKFTVYFSGAKGMTLSTGIKHEPQERRQFTAATKEDGNGNKRECNHFCKNKDMCAHDCCKIGVTIPKKRAANQEFSSYLKDLRTRYDTMNQTSAKRLKMKMEMEESTCSKMQEFVYQPKEKMPVLPKYKGSFHEVPSLRCIDTVVDLTKEHDTHNSFDGDEEYCAKVADEKPPIYEMYHKAGVMAGPYHGPTPTTSTWPIASQSHEPFHQSIYQNPISFDLGNEWGDFDEENLVDACDNSGSASSLKYDKNGFASQSVPCVPSFAAPIRPDSSYIKSEIVSSRPSPSAVIHPHNRLTLDFNKKAFVQKPRLFSEEVQVKTPEFRSSQIPLPFDSFGFFSQTRAAAAAHDQSTQNTSSTIKEEEAFLGIFDGIF